MTDASENRAALIDALQRVPDGAELVKNAVGNLSIIVDGEYVGYVDLTSFETVLFAEEDARDD